MALFPDEHVVPYWSLIRGDRESPNRSIYERIWLKIRRSFGIPNPVLPRKSIPERLTSGHDREWVDLIEKAELLYLVGGGYLTDQFDLERFLTPVEVARHFGVKVETAPLGIGPFNYNHSREYFRCTMQGTTLKVREKDSLAECRATGILAEQCQDDGFRVEEELNFTNIKRRNIVGINYFPQHGNTDKEKVRQWWRDLVFQLRQNHIDIEGFCFHNQISSDFSHTVEVFAEVGIAPSKVHEPFFDYRSACKLIASYKGIVTCRFHAAVVANVAGVPALATGCGQYYKSKMATAVEGAESAQVIDPLTAPIDRALLVILGWS